MLEIYTGPLHSETCDVRRAVGGNKRFISPAKPWKAALHSYSGQALCFFPVSFCAGHWVAPSNSWSSFQLHLREVFGVDKGTIHIPNKCPVSGRWKSSYAELKTAYNMYVS